MPFSRNQLKPIRPITSACIAAAVVIAFAPSKAQNILPTQGAVTSGAASIRQSGADLSIVQTSPRAIVNWGSFSIGQSNGVTFNQPSASSAILNRVTGSARSTIAGQLQANGQVYLINPNGIAITPTGAVQVGGGFVASTLGIADSDFNNPKNGNLNFTGNGASAGVANGGSIQTAPGGFVGLIGGTISNSGVVSVPLGKVAMGSGEQATLNLTGDNFLQVAVPTNTKTADGRALIDVSGKIRAAGGSVVLKAATVAQAIRNAVNIPGDLSVASARVSGGSIILSGGPGGNVSVTGRLKASGRTMGGAIAINGHNVALRRAKLAVSSAKGHGGSVVVTGTNAVSLASTAIDASGATGGGAIRIGGGFHGASDLASAQTTTIDSASTLNASATVSGDGGTVAVWSNAMTTFAGQINATGAGGGAGGYAEVSANPLTHGVLDFVGSANLTAPKGATGTLLLDPYDIVISSGTNSGGSFSGSNPNSWNPTGTSVINNTALENELALANVVVSTGAVGSPGSDAGNITVSAPVSWTSSNGLTLTAANAIAINAPISIAGAGQLTLNYSTTSPTNLSFGNGASVSYAVGTGEGIPGQALTINGNAYTLLYSMSDIANLNVESGNVALATSLTSTTPFTTAVVNEFAATFEGLGNTIRGLTINDPSGPGPDGLFGTLDLGGTIRDLGLIGGSVATGGGVQSVGELVGANYGTVANSYATGAVSSTAASNGAAGGLVGDNEGAVQNSYATGPVSVTGDFPYVGGLVGYNDGAVETSHAGGTVSGTISGAGSYGYVGGLVGYNSLGGTVDTSYAAGAVSGTASVADSTAYVGGLVGYNIGTVQTSYATGGVSGTASGTGSYVAVGGLVGLNDFSEGEGGDVEGVVETSYATGAVTSVNGDAGGLVGDNYGIVQTSYATGAVSGSGSEADVGALVGYNNGTVDASYATGAVQGTGSNAAVGGLVGYNDIDGTVEISYATGAVSGTGADADVGGLVGYNIGAVQNTYATGAVLGSSSNAVGGLVGYNDNNGDFAGAVQTSYSTGAVSGGGNVGGLVGFNNAGTVSTSYWDTQTSGQVTSAGGAGATGVATGQLQGALPAGFTSAWGTGAGLYPYLTNFFPDGVQAVSGFAYASPGVPLASGANGANTVTVAANGKVIGVATTGANGYYYAFAALGSTPSGAQLVAYTQANAATGAANAATYTVSTGAANTSAVDVTGAWQVDLAGSPAGSLSALNTADALAAGSLAPSTFVLPNRQIDFGAGIFALDTNVSLSGTLTLSGAGSVTQSGGALDVGALLVEGGNFALGSANNSVGTLAAVVGNLSLTAGPTVTVGALTDVNNTIATGISSSGTVSVTSENGGIVLSSPIAPATEEDTGPIVSLTAADDITQQFGGSINSAGLTMISSGGAITLNGGFVFSSGNVVLNAADDIIENINNAISASTISATSANGSVVLTSGEGNAASSISGSAPLGFSFTDFDPISVAGITTTTGSIYLQSDGSITQTGPIRGAALIADAFGNVLLNNPNNSVGTLAGAASSEGGATFQFANNKGADLTLGTVNYFLSNDAGGVTAASGSGVSTTGASFGSVSVDISNVGNLVVDSAVQSSDAAAIIVLAATGNFINNVGPGAVGDPWQIYSASPTGDVFGGLNSNNTAVWDTTFGQTVTATGNRYIFAFQPTITVTSTNDSKTYGQDVTSRVATDYIVSGLEPGVAGAFLGDSAASVFSGTPSVTSLGSPARAAVSGGPYPITVAQGTFTASDRYALVLDSAGRLTVDPLALTYAVADATSTYGTTPTLGAATLFGVLSGDTVVPTVGIFSGATAVAISPRTPVGAYSEEVTALSNSDYTIAPAGNAPGTLTVGPKAVTYAVANATSIFGTFPILGPATLFGVLPGDVVIPTVGAFRGLAPVALTPFTPVGQYAELVTALSNPDYRIAPAPNFPGVLTITAATANPGAPTDPGFLPGLTQINNPAQTEYDVGGYEQVLPRFTVNCNEPPSLPDPNRYSDPDQALRAISQSMDNYFKRCENPTQTTIANALDEYAAKLQILAPRLPPALRNVPAIIAESARRVRAARSRSEAVAILHQTVAAIHKEIGLVLSEDPETRGRELRDGDVIVGALDQTSVALVNSGGL